MRLALLGFSHETNTFSRVPADYAQFERYGILRGQALVDQHKTADSMVAGYLAAGDLPGVEVVPLYYARTGPIGTITADAYARITREMAEELKANGPFDGVLLAQHGAAVSADFPDADAECAARIRAIVGPDIPIGISHDMHGNISKRLIEVTNVCTVYRSNPHLDPKARAYECAELIVRTVRGEIRPVQSIETPPLVINILKQGTAEEPMKSMVANCLEVMKRPGILHASVAEGYPYADVLEMGMAFIVVADGDAEAARDAARWMAQQAWDRRAEMVGDAPSVEEALQMAVDSPEGPVVLYDVGDNVGGGSSADSTYFLAAAKKMGVRGMLMSLADPEAVGDCIELGVGSNVTLKVGGKTDDMHGAPVEVTGRIRLIFDGKWEDPNPTHGGYRFFDAGPSVALETTDGHTLVLTSLRRGNTSREQMYQMGIRPETYKVIIAKGVHSPRPAYEPLAKRQIWCNSPGVTTADLNFFTYHRRRKPLYPFELDATYP
jgi:microcystin degradation protein MlrC